MVRMLGLFRRTLAIAVSLSEVVRPVSKARRTATGDLACRIRCGDPDICRTDALAHERRRSFFGSCPRFHV